LRLVVDISEIRLGKTFFVGWKRKTEIEVVRKPANEKAEYKRYWEYVIKQGICYAK